MPALLEPGARSESPRGDPSPTPHQPFLPSPSTANTTVCNHAALLPCPVRRVHEVLRDTAEDARPCTDIGGHSMSKVLGLAPAGRVQTQDIPQPRPGSLLRGAPRGPRSTQNGTPRLPQMCVAIERWPHPFPRVFWFVDAEMVRAGWLSEPVQAEGPIGLHPHARCSQVVGIRAAREKEKEAGGSG